MKKFLLGLLLLLPPLVASADPLIAHGVETAAVIQARINASKSRGLIISMPPGDNVMTAGLTIGKVSGNVLQGKGASELLDYADVLTGTCTHIIAGGDDRESMTLLTVNGAETAIRDMSFFGYTKTQKTAAAPRAARGLLLTRDGAGLGTGGLLLQNIYFAGFETCVQAAVGVTENNCERTTFLKNRFHFSQAGVVLKSQQSMGYGFHDCEWYDTNDCIRVEGGGKLVVTNAFAAHPDDAEEYVFLRMQPRDQALSIGPNGGMYSIRGLYCDAVAKDFKLVSMRPVDDANVRTAYYTNTTFSDFHISFGTVYTEPAVEVAGWSNTTLRDGYGCKTDWISWDNLSSGPLKYTSRVIVENCQIWNCEDGEELAKPSVSYGDCHLIVRNCYDQNNVAITDFDGIITGALTH